MSDDKASKLLPFLIEQANNPEFIKQHQEEWKNYKFDIPDPIKRSLESRQKLLDSVKWQSQYLELTNSISQPFRILNDNLAPLQKSFESFGSSFSNLNRQWPETFNHTLMDSAKRYSEVFNNESLTRLSETFRGLHEPFASSLSSLSEDFYKSFGAISSTMESICTISAKIQYLEMQEQISTIWSTLTPSIISFQNALSATSEVDYSLNQIEDINLISLDFEELKNEMNELSEVKTVDEYDVVKLKNIWGKVWNCIKELMALYALFEYFFPCPIQQELDEQRTITIELMEMMEHQHDEILEVIENIQPDDDDDDHEPSHSGGEDSDDFSNFESHTT